MSEAARKFVNRAPRYVLRASDNKIMRYALEGQEDTVFTTTIVNLSLTGMAFITNLENAPPVGSLIKFEVPVPGGDQVAWWGTVVRTERYKPRRGWHIKDDFDVQDEVMVALHFEKLPEGHQNNIVVGLRAKANEIARQRRVFYKSGLINIFQEHFWKIVIFAICSVLTLAFLYWFTRPSENYDPDRGAPWGQRFNL